jgi:hypothetical protein
MIRSALFLFTSAAFAGPGYTVHVMSFPSGTTSGVMNGINIAGEAAGSGPNATYIAQPFISSPSAGYSIPLPPGWMGAQAVAINDSDQVVGTAPGPQAFTGNPLSITLIPLPPGWSFFIPEALNNSGQVTGYGTGPQTVISSAFGSALIPLPAGGWTAAAGYAINNRGQVAGLVDNNITIGQAFIGNVVSSTVIPLPPGWTFSKALALNDSGQVAGIGSVSATSPTLAFTGGVSGSIAIPLPPGATGATVFGQSINATGVVVGSAVLPSNSGGWIWDATNGTRLLSNLVPAGWNITDGISINDNGVILADGSLNGGMGEYVELVPAVPATPAPGTWILLMSGLALLAIFKKIARV